MRPLMHVRKKKDNCQHYLLRRLRADSIALLTALKLSPLFNQKELSLSAFAVLKINAAVSLRVKSGFTQFLYPEEISRSWC